MNGFIGFHLIADFWNVSPILDPDRVESILLEASRHANATVLGVEVRQFEKEGITGVAILKESHVSIHSWPEKNYLAIDIFTCGVDTMAFEALEYLKNVYSPERFRIKEIRRGKL